MDLYYMYKTPLVNDFYQWGYRSIFSIYRSPRLLQKIDNCWFFKSKIFSPFPHYEEENCRYDLFSTENVCYSAEPIDIPVI